MSVNPTHLPQSPPDHRPGVLATARDGLAIARVAARKAQSGKVAELLRAELGLEPPNGPRRVSRGETAVAGIGPQTWLATRDAADSAFTQSLRSLLGEAASVCDQSDAYAIIRLTGPRVRETLAKLVPVDVHPRSFRVNDVAQTLCGYVSVILWRLEDDAQSSPTFEVWAGRSLADSLRRAIGHGAAEFGFEREPDGDSTVTGSEHA